jgi:hypothetical protein
MPQASISFQSVKRNEIAEKLDLNFGHSDDRSYSGSKMAHDLRLRGEESGGKQSDNRNCLNPYSTPCKGISDI